MKKTEAGRAFKWVMVSLLAAGFLVGTGGMSWADRGRGEGRGEGRYEERFEKREGKRSDHHRHTVIREVPRGSRTVVVNRTTYYVHDHRFYTRGSGGYIAVRPPVGAVVASLPLGAVNVTVGGIFYSRFDNVYYRPAPRGYIVVAPPVAPAVHPVGTVVVWTSALNVRTGPGQHFPVVGQVWQGQMLIVTAHNSGWHYVQTPDGAYGWVMSDYTHSLGAG